MGAATSSQFNSKKQFTFLSRLIPNDAQQVSFFPLFSPFISSHLRHYAEYRCSQLPRTARMETSSRNLRKLLIIGVIVYCLTLPAGKRRQWREWIGTIETRGL